MKKTIIMCMLLLGILGVVSGCKEQNTLQEAANVSVETETNSALVEEVTLQQQNVNISYPKLVHLKESKIEDEWNKVIEDKITSDLELLTDKDQYELSFEIASSSEEYISIKLFGKCIYDGAEQPYNFMYTYNISLATGDSKRLSDETNVNLLASNLYNNKGFQVDEETRVKLMDYIHSAFDNEELLGEMLTNFDYSKDGEQPYGYSYYENGKMYLCVEVPHDLGDFVVIELDSY